MKMQEIWNTLSKINVNEHTEKKGKFTYLGWNFAISTIMEHYPDVTYDFLHYTDSNGMVKDYIISPDGSCSVECFVSIGEHTKKMWLAVTDFNNRPIKNPSCVDISNTKMRCLTKCIASGFGLGFYIYKGEGLPQEDTPEFYTEEQKAKFDEYKDHKVFDGLRQNKKQELSKLLNDNNNSYKVYQDFLDNMKKDIDKFEELDGIF